MYIRKSQPNNLYDRSLSMNKQAEEQSFGAMNVKSLPILNRDNSSQTILNRNDSSQIISASLHFNKMASYLDY